MGAESAGHKGWAGSEILPPTRASPPLYTRRSEWQGHIPPACLGDVPNGTHEDGSWGSGSPLTRAFAGSKPLLESASLPASARITRLGRLAPILGEGATGERVTQARQLESLASHMCLVLCHVVRRKWLSH
jgi:hypothetical protein